jgi:hypothetical protein
MDVRNEHGAMRIMSVPSRELLKLGARIQEAGANFSMWTKEQQEYAAEGKLSAIQFEQELDRTWFECYMALAEHHRELRSARSRDERPRPHGEDERLSFRFPSNDD